MFVPIWAQPYLVLTSFPLATVPNLWRGSDIRISRQNGEHAVTINYSTEAELILYCLPYCNMLKDFASRRLH